MAPQLGVTSNAILQRLQGLTAPGAQANTPKSNVIDQLLASYATGAAIPDPVLDGNEADPLEEYLNAGNPTEQAPVASNPVFTGQPGPRTNDFAPVGIPNDAVMHNLGGNVMQQQLNSGHNPRDVALYWGRKLSGVGDGSIENAIPVGNRVGDDTPLTYNYKTFDDFVKDGARTTQLPPQAFSGNGGGKIEGDSGGQTSNISAGTYAPPSMPTTSTGSYGDTTGLLNQYARSAPKPATSPAVGNAIQQRLARMRGGR